MICTHVILTLIICLLGCMCNFNRDASNSTEEIYSDNSSACDETEFATLGESSEDEVFEDHRDADAEEITRDLNHDF